MGVFPGQRWPAMNPPSASAPELPCLVMRRALWVAVAAWLFALVLGLTRAADDIDREVAAALSLSNIGASLARLSSWDERRAIAEIERLQHAAPLRHLSLSVHDDAGTVLVAPRPPPTPAAPVAWLAALHRALQTPGAAAAVSWPLERADGRTWRITLAASRESERTEAMENLAGALGVVALGAAALLAAMALNVRHAFRPMRGLLQAIAAQRGGDSARLRALPTMPTAELQRIAEALRSLGDALETAESDRRALSHKVMTLQEDERARMARELHDEFGQRLTALRVDAAWLQQRIAGDSAARSVVDGMTRHCERLQRDVRALLARLQPAGESALPAVAAWSQLHAMLEQLVAGWNASPGVAMRFELDCAAESPVDVSTARLPRDLLLAVYRISQEALTNAARHSRAGRVLLRTSLEPAAFGCELDWCACDDGIGIADHEAALQRGSGLAGMRERVWAFGAALTLRPADAVARPGLALHARFVLAPRTPETDDVAAAAG
jgi:two-component system, NarL family, sensor histidine kinase UhpB